MRVLLMMMMKKRIAGIMPGIGVADADHWIEKHGGPDSFGCRGPSRF